MYRLYVDGGSKEPAYFSYKLFDGATELRHLDQWLLNNLIDPALVASGQYVLPELLLPRDVSLTDDSGKQTSNIAEYCALYFGLVDAYTYTGSAPLDVYQDSQLIVNQVNGEYACRKPHLQYWLNAVQYIMKERTTLIWVPRNQIVSILGH